MARTVEFATFQYLQNRHGACSSVFNHKISTSPETRFIWNRHVRTQLILVQIGNTENDMFHYLSCSSFTVSIPIETTMYL